MEEVIRTTDVDEVMENVAISTHECTLSKAEFSYLAKLKIQKIYGMNSPSTTMTILTSQKTANLLFQKSKYHFLLEKRKGNAMMCLRLKLTEDIAFKNWLNRKPEKFFRML